MHGKRMTRVTAAMLFSIWICGCSPSESGVADGTTKIMPVSFASAATPTESNANVNDTSAAIGPINSRQLLGRLAERDRELVNLFYSQFGGAAFGFDNRKELQWMVRQAYPMPEDIIEASRQTDLELERRFDNGDRKAGYFLLERYARRTNGLDSIKGRGLAEQMLVSGGAFSGYAYFDYYRNVKDRWPTALAGLLWANFQGDWRALEYFNRVSSTGGPYAQALAPGDIAVAYQALLANVMVQHQSLLARPVDPLLIYHD